MNQITSIRNGAVVNHSYGKETSDKLLLPVSGIADDDAYVTVNGVEAERDGSNFTAVVPLTKQFNTIEMKSVNNAGTTTHSMEVLWDKASFPRYNFFIDDNIFLFTELAKQRPASLFDHFYPAFLKKMHEKYGAKFTLNLFYHNDHQEFLLKDFPDTYKKEFQANADWLRMSWHSYSEFPDRPYQNAKPEKVAEDFDLLHSEIVRFAGEESFIPPVAAHWSMVRPDGLKELAKRGTRVLVGQMLNPKTSLSEKRSAYMCDIGYFKNLRDCLFMNKHQMLHDFESSITFLHSLLICNYWTSEEIVKIINRAAGDPAYHDLLSFETHEQYSFSSYFNYIPDHLDRVESAIRRAAELGYKPVHFAEGFFGNTVWGK